MQEYWETVPASEAWFLHPEKVSASAVCLFVRFRSARKHIHLEVLRTCLPVRIWPYLYENQPALGMYTHISQNTDKDIPENTEFATSTNANSLPAKLVVEHWWSSRSFKVTVEYENVPPSFSGRFLYWSDWNVISWVGAVQYYIRLLRSYVT